MDDEFGAALDELRRTVRSFLEHKVPESAVRATAESGAGHDPEVWAQMARQLGLQGLMIPVELGGQGSTFVEMAVVLEEMGRALLGGSFLPSAVLATSALLTCGDAEAARTYLPGMSQGQTIAAIAFSEGLTGRPGEAAVVAAGTGSDWTLDGRVDAVVGGCGADLLLVAAPAPDGLGLFAVDGAAVGMERTPLKTLDQTRDVGRLRFTGVRARRIGGDFTAGQRRVLALGAVAMSAELAGVTQRILEMAVDYAKLREQFGKPIGSFQAVKHLCVDILVAAESSASVCGYAARVAVERPEELREAASLAKAYSSQACVAAAEKNIQIHGGVGFTWEHPAHLYLRRAKTAGFLFGDAAYHRDDLAMVLDLVRDTRGSPTSASTDDDVEV